MNDREAGRISGAVEGLIDEAVFRRLATHVHAAAGAVYVKYGKRALMDRLAGYNNAARFSPWLVLVDLDHDEDCAPPFVVSRLPRPSPRMCFRVVVRAVETWLLADRDRIASFLHVDVRSIPRDPEALPDPKRTVVDVAQRSSRRDIRDDMVPRAGSGRRVGPAYTSRLIEFVSDQRRGWRPAVAARSSDSLARCLRCLRRVVS